VIESGHSVLVIGEAGSGVDDLAVSVRDRFESEFTCATETYKGTTRTFFKSLAEQAGVPTEIEVGEGKFKPMSVDEMKEEILSNASEDWLFRHCQLNWVSPWFLRMRTLEITEKSVFQPLKISHFLNKRGFGRLS
jgi:hypothetical protein